MLSLKAQITKTENIEELTNFILRGTKFDMKIIHKTPLISYHLYIGKGTRNTVIQLLTLINSLSIIKREIKC